MNFKPSIGEDLCCAVYTRPVSSLVFFCS